VDPRRCRDQALAAGTFTCVNRVSPARIVLSLALACALGALPACGGSDVDPGPGALGSTAGPTPTTHAAKPSKKPRKSKKPKPSPSPSEDAGEGDGDSVGDDAPVTSGGGVCAEISPSDIGEVTGGDVKGTGLSGGGCLFSPVADRRAPEVTVKDEEYAGMDAAKSEATSAVEGDPEDLAGIGRGAFVVTGTTFGGSDINGAGAVRVGSRTISVLVVQHKAMSRAKVRSVVVELLQLLAREAR
jgi:hypothetical protein